MKHLTEYRASKRVELLLKEIRKSVTRDWQIMEICGGQTHSLVKSGILNLLPDQIAMVHGPGCPVCVTPVSMIDKACELGGRDDVIICSFGDMIRVPGSNGSLLKAKASGANVKVVYSPLDAVEMAMRNPDKEVVFFAVGFETTAPANALSVIQAARKGLSNYSILTSHVLVPPAMEAILDDKDTRIDGFLAAGHVCSIMGTGEYLPIAEKYRIPIIVTGFEPVDLLQGILTCVNQLEQGRFGVMNEYARVVRDEGNQRAKKIIFEVFEPGEREWRGIGTIPGSGYHVRDQYSAYDANRKFDLSTVDNITPNGCRAGDILKGLLKPHECSFFGASCNPENPMGAPMVSSEGACAAYYHYHVV